MKKNLDWVHFGAIPGTHIYRRRNPAGISHTTSRGENSSFLWYSNAFGLSQVGTCKHRTPPVIGARALGYHPVLDQFSDPLEGQGLGIGVGIRERQYSR